MRLPNHIVGGFCLTGFFSSVFFSINILASPALIAATALASIGPDMDNPKSLAGKIVYPVARWINKKTGHRTITHSLIFLVAMAVIGSMIEKTFFGEIRGTIVVVIAWFVHILLDTFTLQGVQLMFPFSFEPYWMFDKPEARIRNGDFRAEGGFFIAFIVLTFAQGGLWENGFWTSYNQTFGTIANLESEQRRSADALHVTAKVKIGTEEKEYQALLVKVEGEKLILLDRNGDFQTIGDDETFLKATFTHTGKPLQIKNQNLISITADSLNRFLARKKLLSLELQATTQFQVTEPNSYPKTVSTYAATLLSRPPSFAAVPQAHTLDTFISDRSYLAEIELLQSEIRRIRSDASAARSAAHDHERKLSELRDEYSATVDMKQRQRLHDEIKTEETRSLPKSEESKIPEIEARIAKIRKEAGFKESAKRREIEAKNREELGKVVELSFTGIVTFFALETQDTVPISAGADTQTPKTHPKPIPQPQQKGYRVIGVKDGDSIDLIDDSTKTTFVVRLAHVDCPEYKQAFGQKAKQFTSDFSFGKTVQLSCTEVDRYGRQICTVFSEGKELNLALVEAGFAWHFKRYSKDQKYSDAETAARAAGLGLWADPNPTPPWEFRKN